MTTVRPLRIGEARMLADVNTGRIATTRTGAYVQCVHTEAITAETQAAKLVGLCADSVTDTRSLDLAIKAAREARLCLNRAEKALRTMQEALNPADGPRPG